MSDGDVSSTTALARRNLSAFAADLRSRESPLTGVVVASVLAVFVVQAVTATRLGAPIGVVTAVVFVEEPVLAWLLSPFLHRDLAHLLANVAVVGFVGRVVEREFSTRDYAAFLVAAAVLAGLGGYLSKAAFTPDPVTAYGASGIAYAVAGYALRLPFRDHPVRPDALAPERVLATTTPAERVAAVFGVAAVATVAVDVATGPYLALDWLNGAHFVGLLVGAWTAGTHRRHRANR
ncbi:rhomboid family intramembrane serine protease [Halorubellus sp. JP-L1]|uniref:rhomboid family intramembrane serine protease n=1 Tax=Halorubellus sp. JP-L1 TaxID=2715753 RepID=UPI001409538B|nr:rhomboid family intramembrane serine protease [Halorubellus sp. JP-L1]NHN41418.1 rhomboid family intramembrane serine protease [Halorubellus sp. JP-L1]